MVEAMEVDEKKSDVAVKKQEQKKPDVYEILREACSQLERYEREVNAVNRAFQAIPKFRKELSADILARLCNAFLGNVPAQKDFLLSLLSVDGTSFDVAMDVDGGTKAAAVSTKSPVAQRSAGGGASSQARPELELFINLCVLFYLVDSANKKSLDESARKDIYAKATACSRALIDRADHYDKRSLDVFLAKAFYYLAFVAERSNNVSSLPKFLNGRLHLAILRCQYNTQATLIVCILRSYLLTKNLAAAGKFVETVTFPESAHNNDIARFFYYQGRIKALQLEYASAARFFEQSLRKAPQDSAVGFKQNVQKWVVVVSLLQGEIPERAVFRNVIHRRTLAPYLRLSQAVRSGNIIEFNRVLQENSATFKTDETLTLVVRLRQNVIKTAIRRISLTYSRIFIKDIAKKLQLPSEAEAEYVVEKAIKDNTITNASIAYDEKKGGGARYLLSSDPQNVYQTREPQFVFDSRITACLELHNTAVRALRYPSDVKADDDIESIEQQRERELMEMEFASEMADEDDDF